MGTTDRWRVLAVAASLACGLLAASAGMAIGHAELESSDPEANAILERSPDAVVLSFRQTIDTETAVLRVVDEHGALLTAPGALQASVDGHELRIGLPPLEPGQYTTEYRVTSALDGHSSAGRLVFLVDPTGTLPLSVPRADLPQEENEAAPVAARWLAVVPLLAAGGTILFWLVGVLPLASTGAAEAQARPPARPPWMALSALALVSSVAVAAYLALLAGSIGVAARHGAGLPFDFAAPFGSTPFAWSMRATLAASLAISVLAGARALFSRPGDPGSRPGDRRISWAVVGLVGVGLAGLAVSAHATLAGGALAGGVQWLHLAAAGVSLGAVPGVLILATRDRRLPRGALRRYAPVGLAGIGVLALSGLANAPLVSGPPRELVASAYGNLLIAKAVLLGAAAGIAVMTALIVRRAGAARRWLVTGQLAALAVAVAAVGASAALTATEPAAHRRGVVGGPPSSALHLYAEADGVRVHAVVNAPAPGVQQYQAVVSDADGVPLDDVERVVMRFRPPDATQLDESEVELRRQEASGAWGIRGAHTPETGEWRLDVRVLFAGEREATVSFTLDVVAPLPPELVPEPADGIAVPAPLALAWSILPRGPSMWLPAAVALIALAALLLAARRARPAADRSRAWTAARLGVGVLAVVLGIAAGSRALVDAAAVPPPEAAQRANPVEATSESVERGRRLYIANCAACHGPDGNGGPLAAGVLPAPQPLAEAIAETTPGGLAYIIAAGKPGTPMPGFVATLSTRDRWDLVNYLRDRFGGGQ